MQKLPFTKHKRPERAAIAVSGPDAASFLQGLLTSDVQGLANGQAVYSALLQPQGKILFDFFVLRDEGRFLIDCSAAQKPELLRRFAFYKLHAKITLEDLIDHEIGVAFLKPDEGQAFADPRSPLLGWRTIAAKGGLPAVEDGHYRYGRIRLGVADSDEIGSGKLFPHEANLDQLGGVSFTKGCFVGQEVVSRMEHRGTARNRILPVDVGGGAPELGSEIKAGEITVGSILSADGRDALALIRLDRLKEAADDRRELLTFAKPVRIRKPPWAKFDVATTADQ